jgi:hypothetical protein
MSDATSSFGHYNPFIMALIEVGPAVESFEDIDINSLSQVIANDRLGRKGTSAWILCVRASTDCDRAVRVKCSPDDTVGDLKKLIAAQTGTDYTKIQLKKW